ncbi:hypothetical protein [Alicyclobacillus ferrooxydans]|uniref:hypothetical protein n=1 Tax=Alicyclobacillus ferrooxydans TaxID=471514 RepID=UPI00147052F9|nr:hypothetical protein [Alicyclobacillus ferrooxydans]
MFGSYFKDESRHGRFMLDTVFVVGGKIPYRRDHSHQDKGVVERVPDWYFPLTIDRILDEDLEFTLYTGATYENPVNGMFSFFPCLTEGSRAKYHGFRRPSFLSPSLSSLFDSSQNQGSKGYYNSVSPYKVWTEITADLTERSEPLSLGINAFV